LKYCLLRSFNDFLFSFWEVFQISDAFSTGFFEIKHYLYWSSLAICCWT
jgi:hypothetical protein